MRFHNVPPLGATIIEPEANVDERGLFARLFDADAFRAAGLPTDFAQALDLAQSPTRYAARPALSG